jgi:hypothetical protein
MNKYLFPFYRIFVPKPVRTILLKKNLRFKILKYFSILRDEEVNEEQKEILTYLENNPVSIFPYPFNGNYSPEQIKVFFDHETRMHYVFQDGKRLYFKKRWNEKRIQKAYADLTREQDKESPHRYLDNDFSVTDEDVIVDIGAAEGNFSLSVIDKVRKVYLIEYDSEWTEALEVTFAPWKDKVVIISKYVADLDDDNHIKLDTFIKKNNDITFIKIDVDGFEEKVLNGFTDILSGDMHLRLALCTYHKNNDEKDFTSLLIQKKFKVTSSKGYMINYYDKKMKAPYLRRGLIRAVR